MLEVIESRGNKNQKCVSPPFRGERFCMLPVLTYPVQVAEQGRGAGRDHRLIEPSLKRNGRRNKRDAGVEATIPDAMRSAR